MHGTQYFLFVGILSADWYLNLLDNSRVVKGQHVINALVRLSISSV